MDALPPAAVEVVKLSPSERGMLSPKEVDSALTQIRQALPNTKIVRAWAAQLPGLVAVELEDGKVAYTDRKGRYLILGVVLDTATGGALDRQLDGSPN